MFAHAWSHIRARHNYKQLPVGHALSACILAANLNPELRQSLLLHLQQNPKAREVFQARHGVDVNTIFATLDAAPQQQQQQQAKQQQQQQGGHLLPSMTAALAATGVGGAGGGAPMLPVVGGANYAQQLQQQQNPAQGGFSAEVSRARRNSACVL